MKRFILRILRLISNKEIIMMEDFLAEVSKLAKSKGRTLHTAEANFSDHGREGSKISVTYSCYVDGYSHYRSDTMEGSLDMLRAAMESPANTNKEHVVAI